MFFLVLGYLNFKCSKNEIEEVEEQIKTEKEKTPSPLLIVILIILAVISIYKTNIEPTRANYAATRAILIGRSGNAQSTLAKYKEALSYKSMQGKYEIRHKLAAFVIQYNEKLYREEGKLDKESLSYTIEEVEKNIKNHPFDYIPNLYIARMYILLIPEEPATAGDKAEAFIEEALSINDKNPRIWYELGQARLSQKKTDGAIEAFQSALALNTEVKESNWFLGMAYLKANEEAQAEEYISRAIELGYNYKKSTKDLGVLINLYGSLGDYLRVISLYKSAIELQPKNPQFYASLAATYKIVGDIENAIFYAQEAGKLDPSFKAGTEEFINSLK